jgi:hypothetical protein
MSDSDIQKIETGDSIKVKQVLDESVTEAVSSIAEFIILKNVMNATDTDQGFGI